jgi:hypothetical protein
MVNNERWNGDGECDNIGTMTVNGAPKEIKLGVR